MIKIVTILSSFILSLPALSLPHRIYKNPEITPESAYPIYKQMQEAKTLYKKGKLKEATPKFIRVLLKASQSKDQKNIDQYDYLYAHYAILADLKRDEKDKKTYVKFAKKILRYLDKSTAKGIWEEGELGQLQMKVYRDVGNDLAKILYKYSKRKDKKLIKQALKYANKAEKYIRIESDFYIKETKKQITNALEGNPPLKSEEKKLKIIKYIKSKKASQKTSKEMTKSEKIQKEIQKVPQIH